MIIHILGEKWKLRFKNIVRADDGEIVAGLVNKSSRTMDIAVEFSDPELTVKDVIDRVSQAYYHEIFHGVFYESGMVDQSWWSEDREHQIISPCEKVFARNFPIKIDVKKLEKMMTQ